MSSEREIKTRCPSCRTRYRFPERVMGRKARCAACGTSFRLPKLNVNDDSARAHRFPSEADILQWLNEEESRPANVTPPRVLRGDHAPFVPAVTPSTPDEPPAASDIALSSKRKLP